MRIKKDWRKRGPSAFVVVAETDTNISVLMSYRFHIIIQAALVIRGLLFAVLTIHGRWIVHKICYPRAFPSIIREFSTFYGKKGHKKGIRRPKQWSLVICGFGIRGVILGRNPRE